MFRKSPGVWLHWAPLVDRDHRATASDKDELGDVGRLIDDAFYPVMSA